MSQTSSRAKKARKSGDIPTRVRRRQSDARWRANVASCYETLKHIIPVNKRASKRQISKASVLQETAKHINFLDNILFALLNEKASRDQEPSGDVWCTNRIQQIRLDFVEKQAIRVAAMNYEKKFKRLRYNKQYCANNNEDVQVAASKVKTERTTTSVTTKRRKAQPAASTDSTASCFPAWDNPIQRKITRMPSVQRTPVYSPCTPAKETRLTAVRRKKASSATGSARRKRLKDADLQAVPVARTLSFEEGSMSPLQVAPLFVVRPTAAAAAIGNQSHPTGFNMDYESSFRDYLDKQSQDGGYTFKVKVDSKKDDLSDLWEADIQCVPDMTLSQNSNSTATDFSGSSPPLRSQLQSFGNPISHGLDHDSTEGVDAFVSPSAKHATNKSLEEPPLQATPKTCGAEYTPIKMQQSPQVSSPGFTPVKLPTTLDEMYSWACNTPDFKGPTETEEDSESLLQCNEPMWSDEEDREAHYTSVRNESTPHRAEITDMCTPPDLLPRNRRKRTTSTCTTDGQSTRSKKTRSTSSGNRHKKASAPRCKRSLELLLNQQNPGEGSNHGNWRTLLGTPLKTDILSCCTDGTPEQDFVDGYLLYYKEMAKTLETNNAPGRRSPDCISEDIQKMWGQLSKEERDTMIVLAKTSDEEGGSDDSNLSEDLAGLTVHPIVPQERYAKMKVFNQDNELGGVWPLSPQIDLNATDEGDYLMCRDSPLLYDNDVSMVPFQTLESEDENLNVVPSGGENEGLATSDLWCLPEISALGEGDTSRPLFVLEDFLLPL